MVVLVRWRLFKIVMMVHASNSSHQSIKALLVCVYGARHFSLNLLAVSVDQMSVPVPIVSDPVVADVEMHDQHTASLPIAMSG